MTCEELRLEYGAYALGIAEDPERGEIDEHLARGCPQCTPGVASARSTVSAMSGLADPADPPARLRRKVLAMVAPEKPEERKSWLGTFVPWGVAATLALALAVTLSRPPAQPPVNPDVAKLRHALSILNDPVTRDVSFGEPAARGRVFVSPTQGVVLIAAQLPKLERGKTFQMWVIPNAGLPISAGTFESGADSTAVHVRPGPVSGAAAVAVTIEPEGGSAQPTSTPFIVTKL